MSDLAGKVAIVTGASAPRGIGRATANRLARAGATVVVTDIAGSSPDVAGGTDRRALLDHLVADVEALGGTALALVVDVTNQNEVRACVADTLGRFGRLDILVNNAGSTAGTGDFLKTTAAQWRTSFEVNLLGTMMFCQAAIPVMQQTGGGSIVNVGSTGSLGAEAGFGAYTAMKHGVIGLTKTIAAEFGPDRIRCNAVCPGYTDTDMHAAVNARLASETDASPAEVAAKRYGSVALRRAADPDEVAAAIVYMAGPQSSYVTGTALPVAGGLSFGL